MVIFIYIFEYLSTRQKMIRKKGKNIDPGTTIELKEKEKHRLKIIYESIESTLHAIDKILNKYDNYKYAEMNDNISVLLFASDLIIINKFVPISEFFGSIEAIEIFEEGRNFFLFNSNINQNDCIYFLVLKLFDIAFYITQKLNLNENNYDFIDSIRYDLNKTNAYFLNLKIDNIETKNKIEYILNFLIAKVDDIQSEI
ncbi:hypothetical protein H312_02098 [Anncaliia algerae PRA339]|uniref:Uncharacterized protein n=1 Tax=Anncaliia algerae PRA339 TaxID=1288291 RepID=A0A059F0I7_9MICR|nr:hypothetical protein H312_02098 [Anncaliia algerae PRA339]